MIEFDNEALEKVIQELEGITDGVEEVVSKASNQTTKRAKRYIVDKIIEEYYINKEKVKPGISMKKATLNNTIAQLTNNRKKDYYGLQNFRVDVPDDGPIKIGLRRSGGLVDLKRAFLRSPRNQPGNMMVFRRLFTESKYRNAIERQFGYSVGGMIENNPDLIEKFINEDLENEFEIKLNDFFEE